MSNNKNAESVIQEAEEEPTVPVSDEEGHTGGENSRAVVGSDIRLKENINLVGYSNSNIPIYEFDYIGKIGRYIGTMAQDLQEMGRDDAVTIMANGYYGVHYDKTDIDFRKI